MKKHFLILIALFALTSSILAQSKGVRIGYIDMEYILQNVPDYTDAKNQLEQKAQKWKQELEAKKSDIAKLNATLNSEKVLLTKELIEERLEEIKFQENELAEYQQKRFGPNGDLVTQKTLLTQPIQDQVFTAVQDISEAKKYDFVFDKASDLTMLFANKRFDISDQVLRVITRTSKRGQLTKKQLKEQEEKDRKQDGILENPELSERQKLIDSKKEAREKLIADKKLVAEARKKDFEDRRQKLLDEKATKKNGTVSGNENKGTTTQATQNTSNAPSQSDNNAAKEAAKAELLLKQQEKAAENKAKQDAKAADFEVRKKALEEKRLKNIADRESAKKAKSEAVPPKN
ncbi:MAG: OmpH family outer membrane protein [Flavobacterium sp.]|nr:OmpH family outer membrane protein [Flavobacterium sp.]